MLIADAPDNGFVYVWGSNMFGQLGTVDTESRFEPTLNRDFSRNGCQMIAAGGYHSIALSGLPALGSHRLTPMQNPSL